MAIKAGHEPNPEVRALRRRIAELESVIAVREDPIGVPDALSVVTHLPAAAICCHRNDRLLVNEAAQRLLGYGAEELPDLDAWFSVVWGRRAGAARAAYLRQREDGFPQTRRVVVRRPDGRRLHLECAAYAHHACEIWLLLDVTPRVETEQALAREHRWFRQYLDLAPVVVVVIAADETLTLLNRYGGELLGYEPVEVLGSNWFDLCIPRRLIDEVRTVFRAVMAGDMATAECYENPVLTKSGEERIISWHNAILTEGGHNVGAMASGVDVTERREMEWQLWEAHEHLEERVSERTLQLREMQADRERFHAMANHELRNALTGVHGWADLFARKHPDDRMAREIVESAEYSIGMLNDLLDLSRLDARALEREIADVDLAEVVRGAVHVVLPAAADMGSTVTVSGVDEPIPAQTDARRVKQILINLLRNAIRHGEGRPIDVRAWTDETRIGLDVTDHGEGIAPDDVPRVFEAYRYAESRVGHGTGLGLPLCKRLAALLGGEITVHSIRGQETCFSVVLSRTLAPSAPGSDAGVSA